MNNKLSSKIKELEVKIKNCHNLLKSNNHYEILKRGFALIKSKDGKLISSVKQFKNKDKIIVEMFDGKVESYVSRAENNQNDQDNFQQKLI